MKINAEVRITTGGRTNGIDIEGCLIETKQIEGFK